MISGTQKFIIDDVSKDGTMHRASANRGKRQRGRPRNELLDAVIVEAAIAEVGAKGGVERPSKGSRLARVSGEGRSTGAGVARPNCSNTPQRYSPFPMMRWTRAP